MLPRANCYNPIGGFHRAAGMERAALRSQLQSFTTLARSRGPRGANFAVGNGWLSRLWRTAFFCLVPFGPFMAGSEAIAADRLDTKKLVDMAHRYQVPVPPKEARVVFASSGWWTRVSDDLFLHVYSPAFLLEEHRDGSVVILRGLKREVLPKRESTDPPAIKPFSAKNIDPRAARFVADFHDRPVLVCAVQLAARGDEATAQDVWRQVSTTTKWTSDRLRMRGLHTEDDMPDAKDEIAKPALILAECIFDDLESRLSHKDASWQNINERMKALVEEIPELSKGDRKATFDDLAATLAARPPAPGSIEAKLLDWSRRPHERPTDDLFEQGCEPDPQPDAPAREIVLRGFDAIPPLLELLRDNRLTAHRDNPELGNGLLRLRHLASILLSGMTGEPDWHHGRDRGEHDAAAQRDWWEHARSRKEVDVFSEVIFEREKGAITSDRACPARILAAKYPTTLPVLLRQFLKETNGRCPWEIARALAESALPKEIKVGALSDAAGQGPVENRRCLLQILAKLDAPKAAELVLPLLKNLPPESDGPYWTSPEAGLRYVVMELADDEVWREFQRAAQRSSVGLRLEMISSGCSCGTPERNCGRALAFLASFLDDATVRTTVPGKFDGPCAAFNFKKIEVRDVAAMELASLFEIKEKPNESWTVDEWQAFRRKVRERLAAEKLPDLKLNK
jgi:hypothetical protein